MGIKRWIGKIQPGKLVPVHRETKMIEIMFTIKKVNATVIRIAMSEMMDEITSADFIYCVQLKQFYA